MSQMPRDFADVQTAALPAADREGLRLRNFTADKRGSKPPPFDWRKDLISAPALVAKAFPDIVWLVPGIIAEGLTLLVGRPKLGKSWLVLDLCIAVASEDGNLMVSVEPGARGDVLYLALEDNQRRLKRRLKKLCPTDNVPERLAFHTEWPRTDQGGIEAIRNWHAEHKDGKLIVIDTLAAIRPIGGNDGYSKDYLAVSELQKLSGEIGVPILVLHHDRKADAEDAFDTVSGTLGITGAADTILVMKRDLGSGTCVLHGRGRDVEELERAMSFSKEACVWRLLGDAGELRLTKERAAVVDAIANAGEPVGPKDIADATGQKQTNVKKLLAKLLADGAIDRAMDDKNKVIRGKYVPRVISGWADER